MRRVLLHILHDLFVITHHCLWAHFVGFKETHFCCFTEHHDGCEDLVFVVEESKTINYNVVSQLSSSVSAAIQSSVIHLCFNGLNNHDQPSNFLGSTNLSISVPVLVLLQRDAADKTVTYVTSVV